MTPNRLPFCSSRWELLKILWVTVFFCLLLYGRRENISIQFPTQVKAKVEWSSNDQWLPALSRSTSEKNNWAINLERIFPIRKIRVTSILPPLKALNWVIKIALPLTGKNPTMEPGRRASLKIPEPE